MRDNKVNVLKKMLGMLLVAPVMLSLSLFAADPVPQHWWKLDENVSGTYLDSAGDANGTCAWSPCPEPNATGIIDGAQSFDNFMETRIDVKDTTTFDNWAQDANVTIEFWMNSNDVPTDNNRIMIGRQQTPRIGGIYDAWYVAIDGDQYPGHIRAAVGSADGLIDHWTAKTSIDNNVTDGEWHHIAFVVTSDMMKVYVDGVLDINETRNTSMLAQHVNTGYVNIGSLERGATNWSYTGALDDIKVYGVELNASVIEQHYLDGFPVIVPPTTTTTTTTSGGGGGGCTYNPDSKHFDMVFLLMIALGLFYPFRRRLIK